MRDSPEVAAPIAERALRSISTAGRLRGLTTAMLASIRLEQGRPAECVELIRALTDKPQHSGPAHSFKAGWYYTAARAEVDRGRTDEARDWTRRAVEAAAAVGLRGQYAYAAMARACSGPADAETVVDLLRTAVDDFTAGSILITAGHARLELARALITVGRTDEAASQVEAAKQLAATCGAGHLHTLAVNAQRRLGALGPRGTARAESAPELSPRERVIATLAGQGLSNRDIARATFLSVKTIESHLTRIFRKLGVESRIKLVQKLAAAPTEDAPRLP